jgi:hypothetical protein
MLDEREINNFERTLGHLLDHPDAANVRDKVKIIHAG